MALKEKCAICKGVIEHKYIPMKKWNVDGPICGKCYSNKIFDHYPGEHARVNSLEKD